MYICEILLYNTKDYVTYGIPYHSVVNTVTEVCKQMILFKKKKKINEKEKNIVSIKMFVKKRCENLVFSLLFVCFG